jgi:hypothetical protein
MLKLLVMVMADDRWTLSIRDFVMLMLATR